MNLSQFKNDNFDRGASLIKEIFWILFGLPLLSSFVPGSFWRVFLLRIFGAEVGRGVVIKPKLHVKFPWRLVVGNNSWVGECVWIDNLVDVVLGDNCCVSQGVYFCTGSHDWSRESFDLITKKISVGRCVWIGAFSRIGPGVEILEGSVCSLGSVLTKSTGVWEIWAGNPCVKLKDRPRY
ncbi:WcaF family extracellular polysaccharide biosynthesis acetyltransferase [Limnobacter sp.]|uniref:WcaF family extracellular polysaccharide biosynthesis acetyltransferase n=1 Tax=Limnobacter sp. TaxID=2003368 RepID=UPI00311E01CC